MKPWPALEQVVPEEQQAGMMGSILKVRILPTLKHMSCLRLTLFCDRRILSMTICQMFDKLLSQSGLWCSPRCGFSDNFLYRILWNIVYICALFLLCFC